VGVDPKSLNLARRLRKKQSPPELKLWKRLRGRRLCGLKFRRQHPVEPYVCDFFCEEAQVCVELDGRHHELQHEHDRERDRSMEDEGILVLRFSVALVEKDTDAVLRTIVQRCQTRIEELKRLES